MVLQDPVLNLLNLLVGLAGGWTVGEAGRAWARSGKWAPVIGGILLLAAAGLMCLLSLALNLHQIALGPLVLGVALGALMRSAARPGSK